MLPLLFSTRGCDASMADLELDELSGQWRKCRTRWRWIDPDRKIMAEFRERTGPRVECTSCPGVCSARVDPPAACVPLGELRNALGGELRCSRYSFPPTLSFETLDPTQVDCDRTSLYSVVAPMLNHLGVARAGRKPNAISGTHALEDARAGRRIHRDYAEPLSSRYSSIRRKKRRTRDNAGLQIMHLMPCTA